MCSGLAPRSRILPPATAAAQHSVPASMRSGMGWYTAPCSRLTPRTTSVPVPAPCICAPMALRHCARSTISGSFAAFSIRVTPSASDAAIMMFSVAPTLGKSR